MIVFENWLEDEIDVVALQEFADSVVNACVREFDEIYSKGFDVSIYIADDEQIRKINAEYRDAVSGIAGRFFTILVTRVAPFGSG